jgi:hypothetical protein
MKKINFKKWGIFLYFLMTGWGIFWVLSFLKIAGASAQNTPGMAQIDIAFGASENYANRTISGSYQEGFSQPCTGNCAHIELGGNSLMLGQQWVSGNSQKVRGGFGALGSMFGGVEPTGRHPYGSQYKVVIGDINESTGTVELQLWYRICDRSPVDLGCSPYGIGPYPFMTLKEQDWIFVGL